MIPYCIRKGREADAFEIRSLLWGMRKTRKEGKDCYIFAIPSSGLDTEEAMVSDVSAEGSANTAD